MAKSYSFAVDIRYFPNTVGFNGNFISVRPVENPIVFDIFPRITGGGGFATADIIFNNNAPLPDQTFVVVNGYKFLFRTNPILGEIPINGLTPELYGENLFQRLFAHPVLSKLYNIAINVANPNSWVIRLTAKNKGDKFNLTVSHNFAANFSLNVVPGSNNTTESNKKNWGMYLDLYVSQSFNLPYQTNVRSYTFPFFSALNDSKFQLIQKLEKFGNAEKSVEFDVSEILKSFVKPEPPNFGDANRLSKRLINQLALYACEYGEFYDLSGSRVYVPSEERGFKEPPAATVTNFAAVGSFDLRPDYPTLDQLFRKYWHRPNTTADKVFPLTLQPKRKIAGLFGREFYYFYFYYDGFEYVTLEYVFHFTDGSTVVYNEPNTTLRFNPFAPIKEGGGVCMEITAANLETIESANGKIIDWFEVYPVQHNGATNYASGNIVGESLELELDKNRCKEETAQIVFLNGLGGYSTLWLCGFEVLKLNSKSYQFEKNIDYNQPEYLRQTAAQYANETLQIYSINSGLLSISEMEWLKDLVTSNQLFLNFGDSNFLPASLLNHDFRLAKNEIGFYLNLELQINLPIIQTTNN